jgi:hypothetical protein
MKEEEKGKKQKCTTLKQLLARMKKLRDEDFPWLMERLGVKPKEKKDDDGRTK